jgi:hypothetical protein
MMDAAREQGNSALEKELREEECLEEERGKEIEMML